MSVCQIILPQPLPANVLPFVWAIAARRSGGDEAACPDPYWLRPDLYRKYTEAMLRRYFRMAMEVGKVPSLIGQEMFRAKVTNYRIAGFDDAVIFVADIDRCLERLTEEERSVIQHVALQEYTAEEAGRLLHISARTLMRQYNLALDSLTLIFFEAKILEPMKTCQEWMDEITSNSLKT